MNEEFFTWAMQRLTSAQFCVYMACKFIGENSETTMNAIGQTCGGLDESTIKVHIKALKKHNFIQCEAVGNGTFIFWIRKSIDDKPLSDHLIRLRTGFKVISPDKKIHLVPRRKLPSFCEKHGLQIDSIYKMKQGVTRTHKGWTVA